MQWINFAEFWRLGILAMVVAQSLPVPGLDYWVTITIETRDHRKTVDVAPFPSLIGAFAVNTPEKLRAWEFVENLFAV